MLTKDQIVPVCSIGCDPSGFTVSEALRLLGLALNQSHSASLHVHARWHDERLKALADRFGLNVLPLDDGLSEDTWYVEHNGARAGSWAEC